MIEGLPVPICTMFWETIIVEGQQCYEIKSNFESGQHKNKGLYLLIDVNNERSEYLPAAEKPPAKDETRQLFQLIQKNSLYFRANWATIYIKTLSLNSVYNPGSYKITAIKEISVTDEFLGFAKKKKLCAENLYERCISDNYMKKAKKSFQLYTTKIINYCENGCQISYSLRMHRQ